MLLVNIKIYIRAACYGVSTVSPAAKGTDACMR